MRLAPPGPPTGRHARPRRIFPLDDRPSPPPFPRAGGGRRHLPGPVAGRPKILVQFTYIIFLYIILSITFGLAPAVPAAAADEDIVGTAAGSGQFTTLVEAPKAADLVDTPRA